MDDGKCDEFSFPLVVWSFLSSSASSVFDIVVSEVLLSALDLLVDSVVLSLDLFVAIVVFSQDLVVGELVLSVLDVAVASVFLMVDNDVVVVAVVVAVSLGLLKAVILLAAVVVVGVVVELGEFVVVVVVVVVDSVDITLFEFAVVELFVFSFLVFSSPSSMLRSMTSGFLDSEESDVVFPSTPLFFFCSLPSLFTALVLLGDVDVVVEVVLPFNILRTESSGVLFGLFLKIKPFKNINFPYYYESFMISDIYCG